MRHTLLLGAMLAATQLAAQQPSFHVYTGYPYSPDIIELTSGNLFTGIGTDDPTEWCTSLLDPSGNLLHTQCYASGSSVGSIGFGFRLKRRNDNEMYFATTVVSSDTCYIFNGEPYRRYHPAVGRMDSLGTILSLHSFDVGTFSCYEPPTGIEVLSDNSTIIFGGHNMAFAIKSDLNGQVIWAKHFEDARHVAFLQELPNGDQITGINFDAGGTVAARLSSDGEVIWTRSFFRPRGWLVDAVVLADGTMVVCGVTDRYVDGLPWPPAENPKLFLAALSESGEVLWSKAVEVAWPSVYSVDLSSAPNGDLNLLAGIGDALVLTRLNTSGDVQWARAYASNGIGFASPEVIHSASGGMIIYGVVAGWADVMFPGWWLSDNGTLLSG